MKNKKKLILTILILILAAVIGGNLYKAYNKSKIFGIYKIEDNRHLNNNESIYVEFEKDNKLKGLIYPTLYNGNQVPGYTFTGSWKLKKNKVIVSYHLPKDIFGNSSNETEIYTTNKNGILKGKTSEILNKKHAISKDKFDKDHKKINKKMKRMLRNMNSEGSNSASDETASEESTTTSINEDSTSTTVDPDEIGEAIYSRVFPSESVDSVEQDGDRYLVSNEYHSADSTIPFKIDGDTVTYWTQAAGDTTADGKNDVHTVKISDLLDN